MRKMIFLGWLIVFLPAMVFAQEKIEAPAWNAGDKWVLTGDGMIEVVKVDQGGYILKFSERICAFEGQGCSAIFFEKSTRNRTNAVEGAYSGDSGHPFRRIPDACSDPFRPPIPEDSGHPAGGRRRWR